MELDFIHWGMLIFKLHHDFTYCKINVKFKAEDTCGSVGWALGFHAGGLESDIGRTNNQGLKISEEKVLHL